MDRLALAKRVVQETGIAGAGPTTTISQTGILGRVVGWVDQAWQDLQIERPDWLFMNKEFSFNTVASTRDYLAADYSITDLSKWKEQTFLIYDSTLDENDQNVLRYMPHQKWYAAYRNQMNVRPTDRPQLFTIMPDNKIRFEPCPDKAYTIQGLYKRTTQIFAANTDVPTNLPEDFHMLIMWNALKYYAFYEDAPDKLDEATIASEALMTRLEIEQLPEMDLDFRALA
jgi:hypothetical protein